MLIKYKTVLLLEIELNKNITYSNKKTYHNIIWGFLQDLMMLKFHDILNF